MKITLNQDYARRHLFVTVLMAALGLWFGYDGLITYPKMTAADLYRSIEKAEPPAEWTSEKLAAFKTQKTQTQYGFAALSLLAALTIGLRLKKAAGFDFEFDESGFTYRGEKFTREDIAEVDRSAWERKSIAVLKLKSGLNVTLDAWHHVGIKEFLASV